MIERICPKCKLNWVSDEEDTDIGQYCGRCGTKLIKVKGG